MLDKVVACLFALGVIAIPFDAIPGIGAFGELGGEASFYLFALAIAVQLLKVVGASLVRMVGAPPGSSMLWLTGGLIVAILLLSALWNAPDIAAARFHGRGGTAKMLTSAGVLIYGVALACLTSAVVPRRWYACLVLPVCISATVCIGYGVPESAHRAGINIPVYAALDAIVHAGSDQEVQPWNNAVNLKLVEAWDKRLRTVSFEPPAFGNFAGLAWPWLLCAVLLTRATRRWLHLLLLSAFTILIIASQARTGWLVLFVDLAVFALLRLVFLPRDGRVIRMAAAYVGSLVLVGLAVIIGFYAANFDAVIAGVIAGDSVSDLSRLAYQVTAMKMFASEPLLGSGLGQFAFKAPMFMPTWGFLSPEIGPSLVHPEAPWPNTYSLYARLAAELGIVGLVGWIALWCLLVTQVRRAALTYAGFGRTVPAVAYPIAMNCVAILVTGITTDTFRTPMIWITLGCGACFVARAAQLRPGKSLYAK
jgi:hypothetical protein